MLRKVAKLIDHSKIRNTIKGVQNLMEGATIFKM